MSAMTNGRLRSPTKAEKSTSACVTLSGGVALNSEAIFGVVLLLLAFATWADPLVCLVISFFPPAVMLNDELHSANLSPCPVLWGVVLQRSTLCILVESYFLHVLESFIQTSVYETI